MDLIATTKAIDCGFFSLTQPQSRFLEIKSCARAVAKTDKPFKFGHADYGDDSLYCYAAIRDPSGRLWSYFYDSDISGGSGGPDALEISICQTLTFEQGTIGEHSFFHLENCEPNETFNAVLRN